MRPAAAPAAPAVRIDADAERQLVQRAARAAPDAPAAAPDNAGPPEPKVQRTRSEDDGVRVDELRVRGLNRKVVVQSKVAGAPAYEIGTDDDARDLSQDRRNEGRTFWRLFSF